MQGLSITHSPGSTPEGRSHFEVLFRPILNDLERYYWLGEGPSTPLIDLWHENGRIFESLTVELPTERGGQSIAHQLFRPGTLPGFASFLRDDWLTLIGLSGSRDQVLAATRAFLDWSFSAFGLAEVPEGTTFYELILSSSPLCFFCDEGRRWEVYARDARLLSRMRRHLRSLGGVEVVERKLMDRALG
ncbi:MAG TPA: hypothetical protein VF017_24230 [Thermoanaerobaculia bacterium]|nr:hypothetical protein [Thermoanaerobaculia bacterium]